MESLPPLHLLLLFPEAFSQNTCKKMYQEANFLLMHQKRFQFHLHQFSNEETDILFKECDLDNDGILVYEDFIKFYSQISMYISDNNYFELLIKNVWNLDGGDTYHFYNFGNKFHLDL